MKRDPYLDRYVKLLERNAARGEKDLDRERKRIDFLEGKCERLELVVLAQKGEAGRDYVDRADRAAPAPRKPLITDVPATNEKPNFAAIRAKWETLTEEQQDQAIKDGAGRPA